MVRTKVGILRGGTGSESDLSLKTGAAFIQALPEDDFDVRDIFIDKKGLWHMRGLPAMPLNTLSGLDVAINALHGGIGEDGTVSRILERAGIPYTGSTALPSAQSLHKSRARNLLQQYGIPIPRGKTFSVHTGTTVHIDDMIQDVFREFPPPYILKPSAEGASFGILYARTILDLADMLRTLLQLFSTVIVEEYIRGQETSVGIVEDFRDEDFYALPPATLGVPAGHYFMPSSVYRDGMDMRVPAPELSHQTKQLLMHYAREAHKALGLEHYSKSDFIVHPSGIYLLEVNALPGLYEGAVLPQMLETVGSSVRELARHALEKELQQ